MRRTLGVLVLLALAGCSSGGDAETDAGDPTTCDELATEASRISEDKDVQLLKVRELKVELDKQETGWDEPVGSDEVVILRCLGVGVWSDGGDSNVRLEWSVDADRDTFVSYRTTR